MIENKIILSTSYLGNIQYFSKLILFEKIIIDIHEHYSKQSYRNRCVICGANGLQSLSIPIEKSENLKTKTKDIKISYAENWQKQHWKSIESAYRSSPFFDYYEDDLQLFYVKKFTFLVDYNHELNLMIFKILGIKPLILFSENFETLQNNEPDYREIIHPKPRLYKDDPLFTPPEYHQVFIEKYGFCPNVSILDLIFNEGKFSTSIIKKGVNYGCNI